MGKCPRQRTSSEHHKVMLVCRFMRGSARALFFVFLFSSLSMFLCSCVVATCLMCLAIVTTTIIVVVASRVDSAPAG